MYQTDPNETKEEILQTDQPLPRNLPLLFWLLLAVPSVGLLSGARLALLLDADLGCCARLMDADLGCESRSTSEPSSDLDRVSRPMYRLLSPDIGIGRLGENSFFVGTNSVCGKPTSMKFIFLFQNFEHDRMMTTQPLNVLALP